MPTGSIKVHGLAEMNRAFKRISGGLDKELKDGLKAAAEPVRVDAEHRAQREIRNIGDRWSRMRVGVTSRVVYVAPKERGSRVARLRRPNLGNLLMDRAMQPALKANENKVVERLDRVLGDISHEWEK